PLNQLQRLQTRVAVLAHYEMVVDGDAQWTRDLDDRLGHVDVGARRGGIAGGMVVHQDDGGGGEVERALDHLARIDRGVVDDAALVLLVCYQVVALVRTPWRRGNSRARSTTTTAPGAVCPRRARADWPPPARS